MYFIFIFSILTIIIGSVLKNKINPVTILGGVWTLVCVLYSIFSEKYDDIGINTSLIVIIYLTLFCFGCLLTYNLLLRSHRVNDYAEIPITMVIRIISIIIILLMPLVLWKYWQIANVGPTTSLLINLRYQTSVLGNDIGILQYIVTLSLVMSAVLNVIYSSGNSNAKWMFRIVIFCAFLMHAALLARAQMLSVIIVYFMISSFYGKLNIKKLFTSSIITIIVFYMITTALNKSSSSILSTVGDYFVPPIIALDILMQTGIYLDTISKSLLFSISNIMILFGIKINSTEIILPFINTPIPTNLYTVVAPYLGFGGIASSSLAALIIGVLHGFIWAKSTTRKPIWVSAYAISIIPLIGQFGGEAYLTLFSYWIQVVFWLIVLLPKVVIHSKFAPPISHTHKNVLISNHNYTLNDRL